MIYKCICGKEFDNPQKFNGHKSNCKIHQIEKHGSLDMWIAHHSNLLNAWVASAPIHRQNKQNKWISEQHRCEHCGTIMVKKFGSGRFCCRACANSRVVTNEHKIKTSESLRGRKLTDKEKEKLLEEPKPKFVYKGPELPVVEVPDHPKHFSIPGKMSLPEAFWKTVLDNNNVAYTQEFPVQKPKGEIGVYRFDFLVGDYDVEIDGRVHNLERVKIKDVRRDKYLQSLGYKVYRINWVNPTSDMKKEIVNNQINNLFEVLGLPRIC